MSSRFLLLAGAAVLLVTAIYHATGLTDARGWVADNRADWIALLWIMPTVTWGIVAAIWAYAAVRGTAAMRIILYMTTIIPVATAIAMLFAIGFHPGVILLALSAVLARIGALKLA